MQLNKLKFISYKDLGSWDAKLYLSSSAVFNPNYKQVLFGEFLNKAAIEKVKISDGNSYKILGVRSYGKGVYLNRESLGKDLKMKEYFKAKPNHLFWCKVDTKNGAFGVVTEDLADGFGSSNMTFAEINTTKINVDFLQMLFTSKKVTAYLDGFVTGTTNRKYIRPDQLFNEIKIPLPPISEQKKIVEAYQNKIKQAQDLEKQAKDLDLEIERYLFKELGISNEEVEVKKGLKIVYFKDILEWGIDKIISKSGFQSNKYTIKPLNSINNLVEDAFRGKSPKYNSSSKTFILNQKCNRWNSIDLQFVKTVEEKWYNSIDEKFFTKEGDILINSTGEGTIGRATYITKENKNLIYDSHLLLLRLNSEIFNPELFVELFNSSFGQSQVEEIKSAQATKQTELGINNLMKIRIPLLVDTIKQGQVVSHIKNLKTQAVNNLTKVNVLLLQANEEFEKTIFN